MLHRYTGAMTLVEVKAVCPDLLATCDFPGHDSSISIITFQAGGRNVQQTIRFRDLPLTCVSFVSETALVGAGHDYNPMIFSSSGGWAVG